MNHHHVRSGLEAFHCKADPGRLIKDRLLTDNKESCFPTQTHTTAALTELRPGTDWVQAEVTAQFQTRVLTFRGSRCAKRAQLHRSQEWAVARHLGQFLKSYCVSWGKWRTNYLRKGKLDILQEGKGGKTVIVILRADAQAGKEGGKKTVLCITFRLRRNSITFCNGTSLLERKGLKVLGPWCNWTTSNPTTRLQHPNSWLPLGLTINDQHTAYALFVCLCVNYIPFPCEQLMKL